MRLTSCLLILFTAALCACAQEAPVIITPNVNEAPAINPSPVPAILPATSTESPVFGLDLFVGMMSGIRADCALWRGDHASLRGEGFYGALLTKFGASEAAGAGLRWQTRRTSADGCHAVVFGPGCDVLFHLDRGNLIMIAPTVELAWHHTIRDTAGWVLGINAGIGVATSGRDTDGDRAAGRVTPLISGFTGFRY